MSEPSRICYICGLARYLQHLVEHPKLAICVWCKERLDAQPKLGG